MNLGISRHVLYSLILSLLTLIGSKPAMQAQTSEGAITTKQLDKAWQQIQQSQKKRLPQDVIRQARALSTEAERLKRFDFLLLATMAEVKTLRDLDPQKSAEAFDRLAKLRDKKWIRSVDRSLLAFAICDAYMAAHQYNAYDNEPSIITQTPRIGDAPIGWSDTQYRSVIFNLIGEVFEDPGLLSGIKASTIKPLTDAECFNERTNESKEIIDESLLTLLLQEYNLRISGNSLLTDTDETDKRDLRSVTQGIQKAKINPTDAAWTQLLELNIRFMRHETGLREYREEKIRIAQANKHLAVAARIYDDLFVQSYFDFAPDNATSSRRKVLDLGQELLAAAPDLLSARLIRNALFRIASPNLNLSLSHLIAPHDSLKIALSGDHYGVSRLQIDVQKIEEAMQPWQPQVGQSLSRTVRAKAIRLLDQTLQTDPELNVQATSRIALPPLASPGLYECSIKPEIIQPFDPQRYTVAPIDKRRVHVSQLFPLQYPSINGDLSVRVLDHYSGHPVPGAQLAIYIADRNHEETAPIPIAVCPTNADGLAVLSKERQSELLSISHKRRTKDKKRVASSSSSDYLLRYRPIAPGDVAYPLMNAQLWYNEDDKWDPKRTDQRIHLYSDRAVYRPGATVQIAGFAYQMGYYTHMAAAVPDAPIQITLRDANGRNIDTISTRTDSYGDFVASFILPTRSLNGRFDVTARLADDDQSLQFTRFFVEQYKRPTFELSLTVPQDVQPKIGGEIRVSGMAKLYSGSGLSNAIVRYTISTKKYDRHRWLRPYPEERAFVIASDSLVTNDSGLFEIPVRLSLPQKLKAEWELDQGKDLFYIYDVTATVIAPNGETHQTSSSIIAGKKPINLVLRNSSNIVEKSRIPSSVFTYTIEPTGLVSTQASVDYSLSSLIEPDHILLTGSIPTDSAFHLPPQVATYPSGEYILRATARTLQGDTASLTERLTLFSTSDTDLPNRDSLFAYASTRDYDSQQPAEIIIGSSLADATVFYNLKSPAGLVERKRIDLKAGKLYRLNPLITAKQLPPALSASIYLVRDGQLKSQTFALSLREKPRNIQMQWTSFRNRLEPGSRETWTVKLLDAQGKPLPHARLSAWMYDGSLDAIRLYAPQEPSMRLWLGLPSHLPSQEYTSTMDHIGLNTTLPSLPNVSYCLYGLHPAVKAIEQFGSIYTGDSWDLRAAPPGQIHGFAIVSTRFGGKGKEVASESHDGGILDESNRDLEKQTKPVQSLRSKFEETAFFLPQLMTDAGGSVSWSFELPDAITRWHLQLLAHTTDMQYGYKHERIEAEKQLMIVPNLPRFLRMGDDGSTSATIYNYTPGKLKGKAEIELFDPTTERTLYKSQKSFTLDPRGSTAVNFPLRAVDGYSIVGIRFKASTPKFTDGEQHLLPQIPASEPIRRTRSFILPPNETRSFDIAPLLPAEQLDNLRISVEYERGQLWPVLRSLPVLINTDSENAIAVSAALYSNLLADRLLSSQPLRLSLDSLLGSTAQLDTVSRLRTSGEAYNILAEEMPWTAEMQHEEKQAAAVKALFEGASLKASIDQLANKLTKLQGADGALSWYPSMTASYTATTYFVQLMDRCTRLNIQIPQELSSTYQKAQLYLDKEILKQIEEIKRHAKGAKCTSLPQSVLHYLYQAAYVGRLSKVNDQILSFALPILYKSMPDLPLYQLPYAATIAIKQGKKALATAAIETLRQHLTYIPDQGTFFAFDPSQAYYWYDSRYPLQTAAIDLFAATRPTDTTTIARMQQWLLSQRRVQIWPSTPATTDIIYGLLIQADGSTPTQEQIAERFGTNPPAKQVLTPQEIQEVRTKPYVIANRMKSTDYGTMYIDFTPMAGQNEPERVRQDSLPLTLVERKAYRVLIHNGAEQLLPLKESDTLSEGEEIRIQIVIRLNQAMDFVCISDTRAACTEPIGALTGYRYAEGTFFYQEARDSRTNFYFDTLQRGQYRLSYPQRVVRSGSYSGGRCVVRSAYAPALTDSEVNQRLNVSPKNK